ncbi:MAG TPA: phospholipase D-like domain-containing protein [Acetobacteraceae bacterium]|nr:phospholipase D-like domain-containing protein [Acetobacteraceae bacterium]
MDRRLLVHSSTRVLVQPEDGIGPVVEMIDAARHGILIKMFSFTAPALIAAVIGAHRRGVPVQVMLNPARSSGTRANDETFARLTEAGIATRWGNPKFAVTHEKSMVVDDRTALIATFNFGDKYFSKTRDYGLVVEDPLVVREIIGGFQADWNRTPFPESSGTEKSHSPLLWSNHNARLVIAEFIDAAQHTLRVQHPKFVDAVILDRLLDAKARGVDVRVLCGGRHGISDYDLLDTFSSLRILRRSDIRVHRQAGLTLHAKLILADGERAIVGSMNIDRSAFDLRRELGAVIASPAAVSRLRQVFHDDWEESHRYVPPDPLEAAPSPHEDEHQHDPELAHE